MKKIRQITYPYQDAMNWQLYKSSLFWALSDQATSDLVERHPDLSDDLGWDCTETDIQLLGDPAHSEALRFRVVATFEPLDEFVDAAGNPD